MRSPTGGMPDKLAQACGTEPIVIVGIQWTDGGQSLFYADRDIDESVRGQIVELSSIDSAMKVDGSTDSSQVRVTLEDTDGKIKALCDIHDLHKRPVWVYQWFYDPLVPLPLADKMLLFKGEINSPFIWNEGDRTVSFDVTTKIEDVEAGFSMEEGDFSIVPSDALGKVWPLVFGSVCDVKAIQVRAPRVGILQLGEGIRDYTLELRICQARYIQCANVPLGESERVTPQTEFTVTSDGVLIFTNTDTTAEEGPDQSCVEGRFHTICDLLNQLEQQRAFEHDTFTVLGADSFPQNVQITLNIQGGKFTGHFEGEIFHVSSRKHPDSIINPAPICHTIDDRSYTVKGLLDTSNWVKTATGSAWYDASVYNGTGGGTDIDPQDLHEFCNNEVQVNPNRTSDGGPVDSQKALDDMPTSSFFWARAGSKVYLEAEAEVLYIVNLLPCTITRVAAMRETPYGPKLVVVPSDYYTIYETDYGDYTVTEIGMTQPLSERVQLIEAPDGTNKSVSAGWSDDLYVTVTSSVGPNPILIIEWLLGKYAPDLNIDYLSFDYVATKLVKYPSNFALMEQKNVMELIADIAYQSRCVVYVRDNTVYLKYVSEEPEEPVATITESDVLANTLKLSFSNTDEVATKHVVSWSRSQEEGKLKIILRHNVVKYGTHQKDLNYYTQNVFANVLKSATFWMIRDANVWKIVEFSTPIKHLALEVFDCVTLDLPDLGNPVKAIITSMKYDSENEQIDFTCWTPLRSGETEPYIHAWPANTPAGTIFPTAEERRAGLDYELTVRPPEGHLLYVEEEDDGQPSYRLSSGDKHPSDLDDVLESCFCPNGMGSAEADALIALADRDPVFEALKVAQKAVRDSQQAQMNTGTNQANNTGSDAHEKKRRVCGSERGSNDGCVCEVIMTIIVPELVGGNRGRSDPCAGPCVAGPYWGIPCTGTLSTWCIPMGSEQSADGLIQQTNAWLKLNKCHYMSGDPKPYLVSKGRCAGDCDTAAMTHDYIVGRPDLVA